MKNLLNNPGFEGLVSAQKVPSGWYTPPEALPVELDGSVTHSGKNGILIVADRKGHALRQDVRALKAAGFIVGGYVKAENVFFGPGEYAYIYCHVLYKGRPQSDATHFQYSLRPGTYTWRRVEEKGAVIPKHEIEKIMVTCTAKFSVGKIWLDDIFLFEASWRSDLGRIGEWVEKYSQHVEVAAKAGIEMAPARTQLAGLREIVGKASTDLPQEDGERLVGRAREVLAKAYQALPPAACAAIWGRMGESRTAEARALFSDLAGTKDLIDADLGKAASIVANMLFPSVVGSCDACYPSRILPVREGWSDPDLLAYMIEQAHRRGIEVCPTLACFLPIAKEDIAGSVYGARPELLSVRHPKDPEHDARFPDPANPQVREILADAAAEIVSRYEADGLGLDFIRYYDHQAMCYCLTCRQAIRERFGFDALAINPFEDRDRWTALKEWRVEQITATVKTIREKVKALKPKVKLFACVTSDPDYARNAFGQDWADFAQHLDFVVPLNYGWAGLDEGLATRQADVLKGRSLFLPAIGGMPADHENLTPDDWITMVNLARSAGAKGVAIYAAGCLRPEIASLLAAGPFQAPAAVPWGAE